MHVDAQRPTLPCVHVRASTFTGVRTALCVVASKDPGRDYIQTNRLGTTDCHSPRSHAVTLSQARSSGGRQSVLQLLLTHIITHNTAARVDAGFVASDIGIGHWACHFLDI